MPEQKLPQYKDLTPEQHKLLSKYGGRFTNEGVIINTPEEAEIQDRMFDRQRDDD